MREEGQLERLVEMSRLYGSDPDHVLAGGGNSSFKTAERLWVKGSGKAMADLRREDFVLMDRAALGRIWQKDYSRDPERREAEVLADLLAARAESEAVKRPSVETLLHDLLEDPFVVHTHPALLNGLACSRQGEEALHRLLGEEALWVPAVNPGYVMASVVRERLRLYRARLGRSASVIVLQNHGLCVSGASPREVGDRVGRVMAAVSGAVGRRPDAGPVSADRERAARLAPAIRMLLMEGDGPGYAASIVVFHTDREVASLVRSPEAFGRFSLALSPDHIVYAGAEPLFVRSGRDPEEQYRLLEEALRARRERQAPPPRVLAVEGLGLFCHGRSRAGADQTLALCLDAVRVGVYAESFGGLQPMSPEQVRFIVGWEAESYRQRVAAGTQRPARLAERIALVTGAAQGFGRGLAEGLAAEGANVVCLDLNGRQVRQTAMDLCGSFGRGRALGLEVDVGEEAAVRQAVEETVLNYGGLDLLVSNAGVLRAGGLDELTPAEFEFVNRVNYTGYYLCTRQACLPMKIQHRFRPGHHSDIIQINSKSGLAGSSRNFAYAGSKFAGVGLTQSFALELAAWNIKVNAVCPGNLFDGPLWSDPDDGLFVQYLRAGKVPGARTVEEVRRFYESKVPMGRGCRIEDVLRAVLYLVEQVYETGQALPVTGGQIMLG